MRTDRSIRAFLAGDELEVRPLAAGEVLTARKRGRELLERYGGDSMDRLLLDGACIAMESLSKNGQTVFRSPEEALDKLTADELIWLVSDVTGTAYLRNSSALGESITQTEQTAKLEQEAPFYEEQIPVPKVETEWTASAVDVGVSGQITPHKMFGRYLEGGAAVPEDEQFLDSRTMILSQHYRDEMQTVSDFFERDNRRYDGQFSWF